MTRLHTSYMVAEGDPIRATVQPYSSEMAPERDHIAAIEFGDLTIQGDFAVVWSALTDAAALLAAAHGNWVAEPTKSVVRHDGVLVNKTEGVPV